MSSYLLIAIIFVVGVILAFPLAILVTVVIGWPLMKLQEFFTHCPKCGRRGLAFVGLIKGPDYPTFHYCRKCDARLKWHHEEWSEATEAEQAGFFCTKRLAR